MLNSFGVLSQNLIQKEPGIFVDPISSFLGVILNYIFNFVYNLSPINALGFSIILLTILAKVLMLPLAVQQQKSMMNMQKVQPDVEKIKKKYKDKKDQDSTQKMNAEIQKLYAEHKVNPFMGCLPLFIQMPIFIALNYIMRQTYRAIDVVGNLYTDISQTIVSAGQSFPLLDLINAKVPKVWHTPGKAPAEWGYAVEKGYNIFIDTTSTDNLKKFLSYFTKKDWEAVFNFYPAQTTKNLDFLFQKKIDMESFFGVDLTANAMDFSGSMSDIFSKMWPGVLIPLLAFTTTFLSSYLLNKQTVAKDDQAKMQQRMILIVMPVMMGVMTASFPAGVGLYWITMNVVQVIQQVALNKYYLKPQLATDTVSINAPKDNPKNYQKKK